MHARSIAILALTTAGIWACLPDTTGDFEDYAERTNAFAPSTDGGGTFDGGAPPVEAVDGLYHGACLTVLASGNVRRVISFFTQTKFVPKEGGGGTLSISMQPLKYVVGSDGDFSPAPVVSSSNLTTEKKDVPAPATPNVEPSGRYTLDLGAVNVAGDANPITQRPVVLTASLQGTFGSSRFCAQLSGAVTSPVTLALDPQQNTCLFAPVKEGDPTPTYTLADFSCPY